MDRTGQSVERSRLASIAAEEQWRAGIPSEPGVGGGLVLRVEYVSDVGDYVMAKPYDGSTYGDEIAVAKPPEVRPSASSGDYTHDGYTQREHDASGDVQTVYPPYDSRVMYAFRPLGGTGVTTGGGDAVVWQEMGSRFWSKTC